MLAERCHYCERDAVVYCDFIDYTPGTLCVTVKTCDRAICPDHRRKVGHICNRRAKSKSDTIDYCSAHVTAEGDDHAHG